jgi:ferric-dicitrate binding protein FerR (iron transport regulator)
LDAATLFKKLLDNTCSPEELEQLMTLLSVGELDPAAAHLIGEQIAKPVPPGEVSADIRLRLEKRLEQILSAGNTPAETPPVKKILPLKSWRNIAAAGILLVVTAAVYFLYNNREAGKIASREGHSHQVKNDVLPGGNRAVLTLSGGKKIMLDDAKEGTLARQGNTKVLKLNNGQLAYVISGQNKKEVLYNTVTTPAGGLYRVILPDGSKVWLNAASSLHFPTVFTGKERMVELTGEAYFEVAAEADKPFKVRVDGMQVAVLGTHFNVMAYNDESAIKTTLLEGAVRVKKGESNVLLQPGQQAEYDRTAARMAVSGTDVEEAVAWKNGMFRFNAADVKTIMREVARWYDITVSYEGNIQERHLTGEAPRNVNLSELIKVLELNGVHSRMEGNRIIVMP